MYKRQGSYMADRLPSRKTGSYYGRQDPIFTSRLLFWQAGSYFYTQAPIFPKKRPTNLQTNDCQSGNVGPLNVEVPKLQEFRLTTFEKSKQGQGMLDFEKKIKSLRASEILKPPRFGIFS